MKEEEADLEFDGAIHIVSPAKNEIPNQATITSGPSIVELLQQKFDPEAKQLVTSYELSVAVVVTGVNDLRLALGVQGIGA
jgi:hypothetical protein